jgi:hypothetical protein
LWISKLSDRATPSARSRSRTARFAADQHRLAIAAVAELDRGAQHDFFLGFGKHHALGIGLGSRGFVSWVSTAVVGLSRAQLRDWR